jgi:hypothetical protein
MFSNRNIWIAANQVIKAHDDPLLYAAQRYNALLDQGNMDGCCVWRRISQAIEELLETKPTGAVH